MANPIRLSIDNPCHENWNDMTPSQQGRFCASCAKQVVDFSNMSDRQLAEFFKKPSTGSVCGRFHTDQLERAIEIPKKRIPWVKYFFQFALPAFLVSLKATAQGNVEIGKVKPLAVERSSHDQVKPATAATNNEGAIQNPFISGKVINKEGEPIPYASIMVKGTLNGAAADGLGLFELRAQGVFVEKNIRLLVSSVGYEDREIMIGENDSRRNILIQLNTRVLDTAKLEATVIVGAVRRVTMGEVAIVSRCTMNSTKTDSVEKLTVKTEDQLQPMIKVYPNPVMTGTSIHVAVEKMKEGYYTVALISLSGQQLFNRQLWIDTEARVLNIDIPAAASGNYYIRFINKETKEAFTEQLAIR